MITIVVEFVNDNETISVVLGEYIYFSLNKSHGGFIKLCFEEENFKVKVDNNLFPF